MYLFWHNNVHVKQCGQEDSLWSFLTIGMRAILSEIIPDLV